MNRIARFIHKKRRLIIILFVPVLLVVVFVFAISKKNVKTVSPKRGPLVDAIYALGTVKADESYTVRLGIQAIMVKIPVREADHVKAGDLLLVINDGIAIRSPISGVVTKVNAEVGEAIMPGNQIVTVTDLSKTHVLVSLDQQSAIKVKHGMPTEISFESIRGTLFKGKVENIYPQEGQFLTWISVSSFPESILPDMTCDVAIELSRKEDELLIPAKSIRQGKVSVLRNGKPMTFRVRASQTSGGWVDAGKEIQESDRIVTGE
jgi:multidrug efflux pump subunit AcrA (membrane-fusion protein)